MENLRIRRASVLLALATLVAALLIAVAAPTPPATGASGVGTVVGEVTGPQQTPVRVKMMWFTRDWRYLGQKKVRNGIYALDLAPGTYRLQFVDQRPSWDLKKYAPGDITVTVRPGPPVQRDVRLTRGAGITGVARGGDGEALRGAKVVAANGGQQSFETKANAKGEFAIGGLPAGRYSVFTWDRSGEWVGKSTWAGGLKRGQVRNVNPRLSTRGGTLLVYLRYGQAAGAKVRQRVTVTVVSKASGQWWSARSSGDGTVTFRGLHPGGYTMTAPGAGDYLAQSGVVRGARVRAGRADLASTFVWTKRGASVTGTVVDAADPTFTLARAEVVLFDRYGSKLGSTRTDSRGRFRLSGQLTTQTGLTVVAHTSPDEGGWMYTRTAKCLFTTAKIPAVSIRTGVTTEAGTLLLARSTDRQQARECLPPTPTPTPTGSPTATPTPTPTATVTVTVTPTPTAGPVS